MAILYMKYLKITVPLLALLILLTVLFTYGAVKEAVMLLGQAGFVILLEILINRYRLKKTPAINIHQHNVFETKLTSK